MNKKVPGSIPVIISLGIFFIVSTSLPAQAAVSKISAQYLVFPATVYVESTITMTICLVNEGETGQLIYDGSANTDHVAISIPIGSNFDELAKPPILISCTTGNPSWICEEPIITGTEILLTMHPNGTVWVQEGEMICFNITPIQVNSRSGLAFLNVDQHFNTKRADRLKNKNLGVFKTDKATSPPYTEIDPLFHGMDTEAELEAKLTDVANVYTNNDGSLVDDDLSDNSINDLSDVDTAGAADNSVLTYSSGQWIAADGVKGADGIHCWDLNGDGVNDPAEDVNGDGTWDALDCQGPQGDQGVAGADGIHCWDLNGNGACDPATEDKNSDTVCDASDCIGPQGLPGADGADGVAGVDGADGINCWDLNANGTCDPATEDKNSDTLCDPLDCIGPQGNSRGRWSRWCGRS